MATRSRNCARTVVNLDRNGFARQRTHDAIALIRRCFYDEQSFRS